MWLFKFKEITEDKFVVEYVYNRAELDGLFIYDRKKHEMNVIKKSAEDITGGQAMRLIGKFSFRFPNKEYKVGILYQIACG